jgi:hypothetical protein
MKIRNFMALGLAVAALMCSSRAEAGDETLYGHGARWRASMRPWHGRQYNVQYGQPIALVVPPTAELTTDYSWGSVSSRMTRNDHQFQRPWPNGYWSPYSYGGYLPTPAWPSDTRQFGIYPIRGPW